MELQEEEIEMTIDGRNTFWTSKTESVTIEGFDFPALLCRRDTVGNTPAEYITKFSLEKVIGKGKVKNKLEKMGKE